MEDPATESLRKLAPSWSLAGDEQLLSLLQNTHQKLLAKCQEANCQLEQMATALNEASISLQNVNNQFMALSSSQFIESRVYDDDDVATETPTVKEPPKLEVPDELTSLKLGVSVLDKAHEVITILHDSDTESDTDDDMPARLVLKPKDMYADRPLPYIIGSQPWKSKWHAGLLLEDSDSDSTASKVDRDSDQYSLSEPEDTQTDKLHVPDTRDTTISETSSELPSEQGSVPKPTPSDVASEIARRLGAREPPKMAEREPEYDEPVKPSIRKVYRPQDPVTTTIFPDEPPPLSEHSDSQDSDIFADLHRNQPYARNHLADDLFGFNENENERQQADSDEGDIFSDFASKPVTDPSAKPTSLFDAGPSPHMFVKQSTAGESKANTVQQRTDDGRSTSDDCGVKSHDDDRGVKKPVGGISLFGNKGTESIGAAILKRNQRKSLSSDEESRSESHSEAQTEQLKKEKDIFDDLFARSEGKKVTKDRADVVQDIKQEIRKKNEERIEKDNKVEKAKVDLFSDNLFDDIDDIFSTEVVKMPPKDNAKSIFEDDDDLFSEIAVQKTNKVDATSSADNKKDLFDSDDELFSENRTKSRPDEKSLDNNKITIAKKNTKSTEILTKVSEPVNVSKETTRSIFDEDEDDIFNEVKATKNIDNVTKVQDAVKNVVKNYNDFDKGNEQIPKEIKPPKASTAVFKSPSLFDDDDDDDGSLFAEPAKSIITQHVASDNHDNLRKESIKTENKNTQHEKINTFTSLANTDFEQNVIINENVNLNKKSDIKIVNSAHKANKSLEEDSANSAISVGENLDTNNSNVSENVTSTKIFDKITQNIKQSSSDTNDEFSDQDFDDLPPKVENKNTINSVYSDVITEAPNIQNVYDNSALQDDIFSKTIDDKQNTVEPEPIFVNTEPDLTDTIRKDIEKTEHDNKTNHPVSENLGTGIFTDILTEPPVFEKPTEPKRSKNVNALFDDDSDDESLFFKKNDVISDEKPDDFIPTQDRLFGIFTDEPPDDDFTKISNDLDDDIFSALPKSNLLQDENLPPLPDMADFEDSTVLPKNEYKTPKMDKIDLHHDVLSPIPKTEKVFEGENKVHDKITKLGHTDKVGESMPRIENLKSETIFSDDDELFKVPENKAKPDLTDKFVNKLSDEEDLFTITPKLGGDSTLATTLPTNLNEELINKKSDDEIFTSLPNLDKHSVPRSEIEQNLSESHENLFKIPTSQPISTLHSENNQNNTEIPTSDTKTDAKKVGKLKVGLNINVNALLPGASPKKVKPNDQTDGQTQSVSDDKPEPKSVADSQTPDSKLLKSVSFDGKPDSEVLDNKISKERAKIQVKRRPSTRRARREAVRKSAIDFGEDSTDNSSSIDDPPRIQVKNISGTDKIANAEDGVNEKQVENIIHRNEPAKNVVEPNNLSKLEPTVPMKTESTSNDNQAAIQPKKNENHSESTISPSYSRDVKSKVVYILNDEDIFNTFPVEKPENTKTDIPRDSKNFENSTESIDTIAGVATLGKVYDKSDSKSDNSAKKEPKSLFGEDADEEIFKGNTAVTKSGIFDSDSDGELFGTSKREVEKKEVKKEIKREMGKGSLFGDEDDDDDLFSVKTKKSIDPKPQPSRSTNKETPKPTELVFEDPLSMFSDDD